MNNSISPLSNTSAESASNAGTANGAAKTPSTLQPQAEPAAPPAATQISEAVTLSTDAQTTAALLDAARNADGVDQARVSQLKNSVQSGAYNITPDALAKAIAASFITSAPVGGVSGNAP